MWTETAVGSLIHITFTARALLLALVDVKVLDAIRFLYALMRIKI